MLLHEKHERPSLEAVFGLSVLGFCIKRWQCDMMDSVEEDPLLMMILKAHSKLM